mmetsp:Transcript_54394/g.126956  ORF Transcript_54394/g.126956 Transcript_54394/m.126956 type:complete len:510 (-) Transcript_54394:148-1677(-)
MAATLKKLVTFCCGEAHEGRERIRPACGAKEIDLKEKVLSTHSVNTPGRMHDVITDNQGRIEDYYDLDHHRLGQGAFAYVVKATAKRSRAVRAVKVLAKAHVKDFPKFKQEIDLMKGMDHPNILHLFEAFEDKRNIYLVMELCTGGELFDRIIAVGTFTEVQAAILMRQILSAVFYMHQNRVTHRDLKPENFIFVDKNPQLESTTLKVIDFGLATYFEPGKLLKTKAGTPYYVSPEVLAGSYNQACDVWACGVVMYILLTGNAPFDGSSDAEILKKVRKGSYSFPKSYWDGVSGEAKDLIKKMLTFDPERRISAESALRDAWMSTKVPKATVKTNVPVELMDRFRSFQAKNKLVKTALRMIAWRLSDTEMKSLRETFVAFDTNGDGILTIAELKDGLAKSGLKEIPQDLQAVMEAVDSDASGAIDYTEFIAAMMRSKTYQQDDLCWQAFKMFDKNGDGKISPAEVREVLSGGTVEEAMGLEAVEKLMREVDTNGDGEIDFDEFMAMMRK